MRFPILNYIHLLHYHTEMSRDFYSTEEVTQTTGRREIYSVSQLNGEARQLLEANFPLIWIEGELSNVARPASGHIYFSLKDTGAQIRGAMFRNRNMLITFKPENGTQVLVRARLSLYEARGDYQLIVEHMEEAGDGVLRRAFEELKSRLSKEGLFDSDSKQLFPTLPKCIGIVTSPSGAAVRDIISVLKRRFPIIPIIIYPTPVQGEDAAKKIAAAINTADQRKDCDVLIVARGGGSLEDLWAFNEEVVARAIHACTLPVITGIGHEVDFTIADFVADVRAPTPSGAAELASPDQVEWLQTLQQFSNRLQTLAQQYLSTQMQRLQWLRKRLQQCHPGQQLQQQSQRIDELDQRLQRKLQANIQHKHMQLRELEARLQQHQPSQRIKHYQTHFNNLKKRLQQLMASQLLQNKQQLQSVSRALDAISPLATLSRGYTIMQKDDGQIVRKSQDVHCGERINARLGTGRLVCEVRDILDNK